MLQKTYAFLKSLGFDAVCTSKEDKENLGIHRSFSYGNLYCEVVTRDWGGGFSIQIHGGTFSKAGTPYGSNYDITELNDLDGVFEKITVQFDFYLKTIEPNGRK